MKTFQQFMEKVGDFGNPPQKTKVKCYKTIPYAMAPGGKACAKRSSSSAGNGD
jgi:hypothetical protein